MALPLHTGPQGLKPGWRQRRNWVPRCWRGCHPHPPPAAQRDLSRQDCEQTHPTYCPHQQEEEQARAQNSRTQLTMVWCPPLSPLLEFRQLRSPLMPSTPPHLPVWTPLHRTPFTP